MPSARLLLLAALAAICSPRSRLSAHPSRSPTPHPPPTLTAAHPSPSASAAAATPCPRTCPCMSHTHPCPGTLRRSRPMPARRRDAGRSRPPSAGPAPDAHTATSKWSATSAAGRGVWRYSQWSRVMVWHNKLYLSCKDVIRWADNGWLLGYSEQHSHFDERSNWSNKTWQGD